MTYSHVKTFELQFKAACLQGYALKLLNSKIVSHSKFHACTS